MPNAVCFKIKMQLKTIIRKINDPIIVSKKEVKLKRKIEIYSLCNLILSIKPLRSSYIQCGMF